MSIGEMDSFPHTLGQRIADCRESRGWKQKVLAEAAGISVTFLSEVENDHRVPGTEALLRLADALETTLDYLVKGTTEVAPPRKPLVIPPELAMLAEERNLSLNETRRAIKASHMAIARRSGTRTADNAEASLTREQWQKLLDWLNQSPL